MILRSPTLKGNLVLRNALLGIGRKVDGIAPAKANILGHLTSIIDDYTRKQNPTIDEDDQFIQEIKSKMQSGSYFCFYYLLLS